MRSSRRRGLRRNFKTNENDEESISTPQFAEEIIRIGTKAQIEYNPLPVDDPKVRQPDRHAREESARLGTR